MSLMRHIHQKHILKAMEEARIVLQERQDGNVYHKRIKMVQEIAKRAIRLALRYREQWGDIHLESRVSSCCRQPMVYVSHISITEKTAHCTITEAQLLQKLSDKQQADRTRECKKCKDIVIRCFYLGYCQLSVHHVFYPPSAGISSKKTVLFEIYRPELRKSYFQRSTGKQLQTATITF